MENKKLIQFFALMGFAILIAIAIWSSYKIIKLAPELTSSNFNILSIFKYKKEKISLEDNLIETKSQESVKINWELSTKYDGDLYFSYACVPGIHLRLPAVSYSANKKDVKVDTTNYTVLPCNVPHKLQNNQNMLVVVPVSDNQEAVTLKYAIVYTYKEPVNDNNYIQAIGDIKILPINTDEDDTKQTINAIKDIVADTDTTSSTTTNQVQFTQTQSTQQIQNKSPQTTQSIQKTKTNTQTKLAQKPVRYVTVVTKPINNPNGLADLQIDILSVGAVDPYTGAFTPKGTLAIGERAAIKFKVKNIGDKETGPWIYKADLPTFPKYYYVSKMQPSLLPGGEATIIVSFDKMIQGRVNALIQVDPYNTITERNETNNADNIFFNVTNMNIY